MDAAQIAAFQRATELLEDLADSNLGWPRPSSVLPYRCPWPPPDNVGLAVAGAAGLLTAEAADWFTSRGWIACPFGDEVIVAPLVGVALPAFCYHVSPADNEAAILSRGLLRGAGAGRSTTGRPDAGRRVHVCFNEADAVRWTGEKLLGQHRPGEEWVLFAIDVRGVEGMAFRDPASRTGYVLEAGAVRPEFLRAASARSVKRPGP